MILKIVLTNCCPAFHMAFWAALGERSMGSRAAVGSGHGECGQQIEPVDL